MKGERIILIDGSSYFFRAFYAIQRLTNSKGFPTNAIYGFINMLLKTLEVEQPGKLAICFDTAKPTFRKERYAEYKSNRERPPDDLVKQIPHIFRAVDCFGIPRFEMEGYEADDIIGTVAQRAEREGYKVDIITGDKDLMQLVNDNVALYDSMKDKRTDEAGVVEKFGVKPTQIVDFLALVGDSSDNIPGVSGIGEKTAAELIKEFGSLDGIYKGLDRIKSQKRRETLEREKDVAYLSKELATVCKDVPMEVEWEKLDYKGPIKEKLQAFLQEFEFQGLMKRLGLEAKETQFHSGNYTTVASEPQLKELVEKWRKAPLISVDTETTSLNIHDADLVGISLSDAEGKGYYIPMLHHIPGAPTELLRDQLSAETVRKYLQPVLESREIGKVGQNLKYDYQVLKRWGVNLRGIVSDTLIASYLLDPDSPHNLDSLAFRHLGHQNITYEDVTGKGKNQVSFAEVTIEKATQYSGEDADVAFRLHQKLAPLVKKQDLWNLYETVELPLIEVLAEMEYGGVLVDRERLETMQVALEREIGLVQEEIFKLAGGPINCNSPKQLSELLFGKLKLPVLRKTKTGFSTDETVLLVLSREHEIARWLLRFRELGKIKSTYVDGLLLQIHPQTRRVHTNYNQTVAATGRLSSTNPNLQNIPAASEAQYDVRSAFVAEKGFRLLSADYSQVELRLLADMSGDPVLSEAFAQDQDVHEFTARLIFGSETVSSDQRKVAKTINFGVIYGQTPYGLSQQLGISTTQAKEFIDKYFARYPQVHAFMRGLAESAAKSGYAKTRLGRRRYLPEINASNRMRREMAERAAINTPLQGTAADLIKIAMVNLHAELKKQKLQSRMILQVHDELVLEVPEKESSLVEKLLRDQMEHAMKLTVPLKVDMAWGNNWRECD